MFLFINAIHKVKNYTSHRLRLFGLHERSGLVLIPLKSCGIQSIGKNELRRINDQLNVYWILNGSKHGILMPATTSAAHSRRIGC